MTPDHVRELYATELGYLMDLGAVEVLLIACLIACLFAGSIDIRLID